MDVFMSMVMLREPTTLTMRSRIRTTLVTMTMSTRITSVTDIQMFMITGTGMEAPIAARM
jgi:hypothetical protein